MMVFPLIVQGVLTASLSYFDLLLLAKLGTEEVSAVALSGGILMVLLSIQIGFAQSVIALKGEEDAANVNAFYLALSMATLLSVLMGFSLWLNIEVIVDAVVSKPALNTLVSTYLSWLVFSLPVTQMTLCCGFFLRSYGKTKVTLTGFLIEVPINVLVSYWLIYPSTMGIEGAALGSLIARFVRLLWMGFHTVKHIHARQGQTTASIDRRVILKKISGLFGTSFASSVGGSAASVFLYAHLARLPSETFAGYSMIMSIQGMALTVMNAVASMIAVMAKMDIKNDPMSVVVSYSHEIDYFLRVSMVFFFFASIISVSVSGIALDLMLSSTLIMVSLDLGMKSLSSYFSVSYLKVFGFHRVAVTYEVLGRCFLQSSMVWLLVVVDIRQIIGYVMAVVVAETLTLCLLRRAFEQRKIEARSRYQGGRFNR
ncbi:MULTISPECIES: MATE family efflux transporter [Vibrio]|jgi:hypothetical protein|uniref:MATE family efflux transporter n=1 Tax=Vibrio TaxID=662 RepID=UPI00178CB783|nr:MULTISPECIES: MATE family efflux transporter [Vibrio]MDL5029123.1 MATE family efflux transporter [Vibrio sp. TMPB1044]MDN3632865.1 MATE family efflux transporter [Vibrio lentus]MDN5209251.1 MATE family efflux transporter [Vibrio sp. TMPB1044]